MESVQSAFEKVAFLLHQLGLNTVMEDKARPWGGFYVIEETQAESFIKHFFPGEIIENIKISGKLSPKILLVAPGKRLSWQYHFRRAEIWKCVEGPVSVVTSESDEEKEAIILQSGDTIKLKKGERHRLIGLDDWGIIAEIWQHTDALHPSDEEDIVRLKDDFGR